MNKAHVEHAVGFVEDQIFDATQVGVALVHQIEQTARRGDDNIDTLPHSVDLRILSDAAEDSRLAEFEILAVDSE